MGFAGVQASDEKVKSLQDLPAYPRAFVVRRLIVFVGIVIGYGQNSFYLFGTPKCQVCHYIKLKTRAAVREQACPSRNSLKEMSLMCLPWPAGMPVTT